jgi:hypothetical protein
MEVSCVKPVDGCHVTALDVEAGRRPNTGQVHAVVSARDPSDTAAREVSL